MTGLYNYAVVGAGRQGVAAAYDLVKRGQAASILLLDTNAEVTAHAVERIKRLTGHAVVNAAEVDVRDHKALVQHLRPVDVCVCAVPWVFVLDCTHAAIESHTSMVDLGGRTDIVLQQLAMNDEAIAADVTVVPDCGMGPGMNNTLGVYAVEQLQARGATPREVRLWDGGLPQNPPEPWGYQCSFHINGLTNEYDGQALILRGGIVTSVDALTEPEMIEFDGLGKFEAFVTSGGTSTVPYTYQGVLQVYENKTLRYPGHYVQFKAFKDLGLFSEQPISIAPGLTVSPRQLYHALLSSSIETGRVIDICLMRARGTGDKDGRVLSVVIDLIDRYDVITGFTAMERLTGWHAAIMAQFIARREIPLGVWPLEKAVSATRFLEEVRHRGFQVTERWEESTAYEFK